MMCAEKAPSSLHLLESNTTILLPEADDSRDSIFSELAQLESQAIRGILDDKMAPISFPSPDPDSKIQDFTRDLMNQTAYLHSTVVTTANDTKIDESLAQSIRDSAYEKMCEKLSVISVDLIKNQSMTRTMLAQAQQGDDYLNTIRERVGTPDNPFPNFYLKNQVLYKKFVSKNPMVEKHVICIPDVLLPSVVHTLHVNLGHSSATVTKRNFEQYYYNRNSTRMIKNYVQSCVTCALAHKFDIKKTSPETNRSLQPNRPRQHIYCDLIPMFKGTYSYILFCLDAYSQYIYALPIKDKTSTSVLQGFLSLFATTGWPEAIYLDNETSFQKTAKLLVKMAPIRVLYSTPYSQFQNWSENYIKNFKKSFLKLLNDSEEPQDNADWPLLLPTVTQALNRQVIPDLGMTRESIHFNMDADFYPLAHLSSAADAYINQTVNAEVPNAFKIILEKRKRNRANNKTRTFVPKFHETQLVFMRDQAPSVSSILKIPNKGPYRIDKLEDRNATLTEIGTGKTVHAHVQNIRPLEFSEFRLLLTKGWDLNAHQLKAGLPVSKPGIFDAPQNPVPEETVVEIERQRDQPLEQPEEGDLQQLFQLPAQAEQVPLLPEVPQQEPAEGPAPVPPDIQAENPPQEPTVVLRRSPRLNPTRAILSTFEIDSDFSDGDSTENETDDNEKFVSINTIDVHLEISRTYKEKIDRKPATSEESCSDVSQDQPKSILRKRKTVSFYLPEMPPHLFYPGR
jgi:hypothetical protein